MIKKYLIAIVLSPTAATAVGAEAPPFNFLPGDECNIEPIRRDENSKTFRAANGLKDGNDMFA